MIIKTIKLKNFSSFKGDHFVNIGKGLIRIIGINLDNEGATSNRVGKTSLLNAFSCCIYNKTPLISRPGNLINDESDSAQLEIIFSNEVHIKRYFRDKDFGNSVLFNEKNITQEQLDEKLGVNFNAVISCNFFGTAYSDFLEKILRRPAEAKDLLISLLPNLQVFDMALEWIKEKISETENNVNYIERTIAVNIGKLESYQNMNYTAEIEKFEQNRLNNISREENEIIGLVGTLKLKEREIIPNLEATYKKFLVDKNIVQERYNKVNTKRATLVTTTKYLEKEVGQLESEIKNIKTGKCPYCGQDLPKKEKLSKEKEELLKAKIDQMELSDANLGKTTEEISAVGLELTALGQEEREFEKLRALNVKILTLNNAVIHKKEFIKKLKEDENPYIVKEAEAAKAMIEIQKEIGKLKTDLEVNKDQLQYYLFWEKGFGPRGIKNFIFDEIIFRLTDLSQTYLDEMTENSMIIRFDPRKAKKAGGFIETIGLEISSKGNPRDYFTWSASERKKVSLAVDLAMNQMLSEMFNSPFEFMVFDETFDGLDSVGVELFCSALKKQLKKTPQIFVVSHIELPDIFDHTITIVKENGCSRIEGGIVNKKLLRRK